MSEGRLGAQSTTRSATALSSTALTLRSMRAFRGGLVALGIVVLLATAGVVAWPAATAAIVSADARHRLDEAPSVERSISGVLPLQTYFGATPDETDGVWSAMPLALHQARDAMQPALRTATRPGRFVGRSDGVGQGSTVPKGLPVVPVSTDPQRSALGISVEGDPALHSDAVLDAGRWPAGGYAAGATEVVVATKAARQLHWKVGAARTVVLSQDAVQASGIDVAASGDRPTLRLRLVGTISPRDGTADFWTGDPVRSALGVGVSSDPNSRTTLYHGVVWMDADAWPHLAPALGSPYLSAWFGLDTARVSVPQLSSIAAAATSFAATPIPVGAGASPIELRMSSRLPDIVDATLARIGSVPTILAIVAVGPLGAAVAVLFSGARLMSSRRARSLELLRARGGSEWRVRGGAAVEAAAVTIPAAIVGGVAALLVVHAAASAVLLIAACALLPPCAVAITASSEVRARGRRRPVVSWIAELLVVLLAAAACVVLVERGSHRATPLQVDPLLVATPLLIVFAVCVLVLRVYPLLLGALGRATRAMTGAVGQVGWATAARGSAGRLWPLFAMLTGVSVAVFAGNTLSLVLTGAQQDAVSRVGADITVSADLSRAQLDRLHSVPGVADTAELLLVGYGEASSGQTIPTYLVDARKVIAVQADVPERTRLFPVGTVTSDGAAATVLGGLPSSALPRSFAFDNGRTRMPVRVVAHARSSSAPFLTDDVWAIIDSAHAPEAVREGAFVTTALIGVRSGFDVGRVAADVQRAVGSGAQVDSTAAAMERQSSGPLLPGIQSLILAGAVLSVVMAVAALLLTLAMGRGARVRLLGVLRTLGFDRGQSAALVAWEITPLTITAIVAGVVTGLGLCRVVLAAIDLRPITGALARPDFAVSWPVVAIVVGVFAAGAALAVVAAVAAARRTDAARTLRSGEDS